MKIKTKLLISFLLISILPLILISTLLISFTNNSIVDLTKKDEAALVKAEAKRISGLFKQIITKIYYTSTTPPIEGIARSLKTGNDPVDGSSLKEWNDRLKTIFTSTLRTDHLLHQLSYLDEKGNELVKVVKINKVIWPFQEYELQNNSKKSFYREALNTDPKQVYISNIEMIKKHRSNDKNKIPVIYFIKKIVDRAGNLKAMLCFAVNVQHLIDHLRNIGIEKPIITDQNGNFISHYNEEKSYSKQRKTHHNFFKEQPELMRNTLLQYKKNHYDENDEEFRIWRKIFFDQNEHSRYWIYFSVIPEKQLLFQVNIHKNIALVLIIIFSTISALLSILIAKTISEPIMKVTDTATEISLGNYKAKIDDIDPNVDNEIIELSKAINRMSDNLHTTFTSLEMQKKALDQFTIVAETDAKGKITYVNDQFCRVSKYSREELIGKDHRIINSHYHPKSFWKDFWNTIQAGNIWRGEVKNLAKDGSFYWVDTTIVPFKGPAGKPEKYLAIRVVITDRKLQEEKLNTSNKELEQFAYVASHDLQEPLRKISAFSELLEQELSTNEKNDVKTYLKSITSAAMRMRKLIDDLLSFSRVAQKKIEAKEVDLNQLVAEVIDILELSIKDSHAKITYENLPTVNASATLLQQVFQNLIANAIKFQKEDSQPKITITAKKSGLFHTIQIEDNGIGLDQKHNDKIFEVFQRLHAKHEFKGTGIGLAICKRIIERHGGKIWVESEPDQGTRFIFTIPV